MDLSKIYLATAMVLVISRMVLGEEPDYNNPDVALRHDMWILDADVRKSALSGYKRRFNLGDDEFSAQLVKLASVTTNGEDATLRMFTVAAIGDFGTTNALEFLKNEALRGRDIAGGIDGYGAITDYDERFIRLARQMTEDKRMAVYRRRVVVYNAMRPVLKADIFRGRLIGNEAKERVKDFLLLAAKTDPILTDYIDGILCEGIGNYNGSEARREIILGMLDNSKLVQSARDYYKTELRKLDEAFKSESPVQPSSRLHRGTYTVFALILTAIAATASVLLIRARHAFSHGKGK